MRSERLKRPLDPAAAAFLASAEEDHDLIEVDLIGSAAHVKTLAAAGVLDDQEAGSLLEGLLTAFRLTRAGEFQLSQEHEDVHLNVEAWLTERLGDLGKRLHTGRSRNDQVALDLRLATRRQLLWEAHATVEVVEALSELASKAPAAILPGVTHTQPAQPVAFAHWCGMHIERFLRDLDRMRDAYGRLAINPLGAAALAGTSFPIDPARTAENLAFESSFANSMDAVSDRDFLVETFSGFALLSVHVSQLADDVVHWAAPAHGLVRLDDAYATGSSIMPQKRNPDTFELARGTSATAIGEANTMLVALKGLGGTYSTDLQEQKRVAIVAWRRRRALLSVLPRAIATLEPVPERMLAAANVGHMDATEVADHLARGGVPFRDAHAVAARLVDAASEKAVAISSLDDATLQKILGEPWKSIRQRLGPEATVSSKTSPGGTAASSLDAQGETQARRLSELAAYFSRRAERVARSEKAVLQPTDGRRAETGPS